MCAKRKEKKDKNEMKENYFKKCSELNRGYPKSNQPITSYS